MLVIVGSVKMADRIVREMIGTVNLKRTQKSLFAVVFYEEL